MEYKPAFYALIRLHAELAYRIKANKDEGEKLRDDMLHIEAVLKILEPGFSTRRIAAKRKHTENPWFKRGTIFRAVLEVLKAAPAPMSAEEIGVALLQSKGIAEPTRDQRRHMYSAVDSSLRSHLGRRWRPMTAGRDGGVW